MKKSDSKHGAKSARARQVTPPRAVRPRASHQQKNETKKMTTTTYLAELKDGGKSASFDTIEEALAYIAKNFRTEADELGTWSNDDIETLVWMTQDAADDAEDNSDVIATITETDA